MEAVWEWLAENKLLSGLGGTALLLFIAGARWAVRKLRQARPTIKVNPGFGMIPGFSN